MCVDIYKKKKTCFSAFATEPLLAVSLPHVDVAAARLGEGLPTDPAVVRFLAWRWGVGGDTEGDVRFL